MAYAALLSLAQILHQTLNRDYQYLILDEKKQIESLVEEVTFLQNCLSSQKLTQDMETKIRDAAFIAEEIIESRIIDRFLTESAGHEDGSKEKILIRFDVIESWFVELSKFDSDFQMVLEIPRLGGIVAIDGIRQLAKTRRFKAWFLDPSIFLNFGLSDAIYALKKLATYGTKMVIISDSSNPASTTMEKLRIFGFDTSLFVGFITREDLRADDAGFEQPGPSHIDVTSEMYKSAMVMAGGVDAADCIALVKRLNDIKGANAAGISSVFVDRYSLHLTLSARHDDALPSPTYTLPSFTW